MRETTAAIMEESVRAFYLLGRLDKEQEMMEAAVKAGAARLSVDSEGVRRFDFLRWDAKRKEQQLVAYSDLEKEPHQTVIASLGRMSR